MQNAQTDALKLMAIIVPRERETSPPDLLEKTALHSRIHAELSALSVSEDDNFWQRDE